jgi:hypothetical protein
MFDGATSYGSFVLLASLPYLESNESLVVISD